MQFDSGAQINLAESKFIRSAKPKMKPAAQPADWKALATTIRDSQGLAVKSRSGRAHTLADGRSGRNARAGAHGAGGEPTDEDKIRRLAQLTHEHRQRFGKRHASQAHDSALS